MPWDTRLKDKLKNIFSALGGQRGSAKEQQDLYAALEEQLYLADLGAGVVTRLLADLHAIATPLTLETATAQIHQSLLTLLQPHAELTLPSSHAIIFLIGVNGAGKTTTVAKLAHHYKQDTSHTVMLAAADTFRAAASQQLQIWAQRLEVTCIAQPPGADPAAVVFDAVSAAKARGISHLLIDTGGRLHTNQNLIGSLQKMQRSAQKAWGESSAAPIYNWLIMDATLGQNSVQQAQRFAGSIPLHGLIVTKYDGIAKAGALVAIVEQLKLPVHFIGTGEQLVDLHPFDATTYVNRLLEG